MRQLNEIAEDRCIECETIGPDKCSSHCGEELCETCKGDGREMIDFGNGDIRDIECSICNGDKSI